MTTIVLRMCLNTLNKGLSLPPPSNIDMDESQTKRLLQLAFALANSNNTFCI